MPIKLGVAKIFKRLAFALFTTVFLLATLLASYAYMLVTDFGQAVLVKIRVQNFIGHRDVSDELVWLLVDESNRLETAIKEIQNKDPHRCIAKSTTRECFENFVKNEVVANSLSPSGLMQLGAYGISISFYAKDADTENSLMKTWHAAKTMHELYGQLDKSKLAVTRSIESKFGPLSDVQKGIITYALENPFSGLRDKVQGYGIFSRRPANEDQNNLQIWNLSH